VSFDLEFTGVTLSNIFKDCCYDDLEMIHAKKKKIVESFDVIQFGLTLFFEKESKTYEFLLLKDNYKSNDITQIDLQSLRFLISNGIDLNLIIKEGIPYLNKTELLQFKEKRQSVEKNKIKDLKHLPIFDEINKNREDMFFIVPQNDFFSKAIYQKYGDNESYFLCPGRYNGSKAIKFVKVKENYEKTKREEEQKLRGFSRVIDLLINSKKSLVY
jgi:hypothetical protein